ncbi:uncharacterized protein LOC106776756 isoform X2 [Vigna radiata var. radiata]|uniref:Uncharacterized protein LOC106776756 isoform X2 n=1 Tax=Vigna radiata var. radiata TaxID=3916 RepID=A0A3Q0ERP5_VIGRR|nr:uncharacterized protein LOC106776756 isoform X2 [Vigna radiata var. radiata]
MIAALFGWIILWSYPYDKPRLIITFKYSANSAVCPPLGFPTIVPCMSGKDNNKRDRMEAALAATPSDADAPTIFDKIINKEIPSTVVIRCLPSGT